MTYHLLYYKAYYDRFISFTCEAFFQRIRDFGLFVGLLQREGQPQMKRLPCFPWRLWTNSMRSLGPQCVLLWCWWRPSLDYSWLSFDQHLFSSTAATVLSLHQPLSYIFHFLLKKSLCFSSLIFVLVSYILRLLIRQTISEMLIFYSQYIK